MHRILKLTTARQSRTSRRVLEPPVVLGRQVVQSDDGHRSLADHYHELTKHTRRSVMGGGRAGFLSRRPAVFKAYPEAERITLPEPPERVGLTVGAAIEASRRPVAGFAPESISLTDLSAMLFMTNGVTETLDYPGVKHYLRGGTIGRGRCIRP